MTYNELMGTLKTLLTHSFACSLARSLTHSLTHWVQFNHPDHRAVARGKVETETYLWLVRRQIFQRWTRTEANRYR